jgi:excisionase family DNA binding protein
MSTMTFALMLKIPEAAERLGIQASTLRNWIMKRKIGYTRVGSRSVRIPLSEVERILADGFVPAKTAKRRPSAAGN